MGLELILISNAKILTMTGRDYDRGCILIQGGKIKKIAEHIDLRENTDDVHINAKGLWVLPGLIDAHSHLGIYEEKKGQIGDNSNETAKAITPYIKALDAVNPMDSGFHNAIRTGITSVMVGPGSSNVVGGQFLFMKTHGRCIDDMLVLEPAAMKIAFGENPKTNYGDNNQMPSSRMSIGAMLREELFLAKQYADNKKSAAESGSYFKEDFREECWLPVLNNEIPLKAHVHRADDILTAIRIAKLYDLKLTLDHCTEGHLITEEIKRSGYPAIIGILRQPAYSIRPE
jgi:imidazolonepropionase-like amidohydrolase